MKKDFVTKEELMVGRTPQELVEWVDRKFQEIPQQEGGRQAILMKEGLLKQFAEEVYPLSIFAKFKFDDRNDVTLQPVIGDQNYDVLITDCSFSPPNVSKLEITQAHEGEQDYLKRVMLLEKGGTPISQPIMKTGTKNAGGIEVKASRGAVYPVEDYQNKQINLIIEALKRKIKKEYESNTSLLIFFLEQIKVNEIDVREAFYRFIEDELGSENIPFSAIYLVSSSKRIFLKWLSSSDG